MRSLNGLIHDLKKIFIVAWEIVDIRKKPYNFLRVGSEISSFVA